MPIGYVADRAALKKLGDAAVATLESMPPPTQPPAVVA
jgi:hypothetical protein